MCWVYSAALDISAGYSILSVGVGKTEQTIMELLSSKESVVLSVIKKFKARNGHMPTFQEMLDECNKIGFAIKSKGSIFTYLKSLEEKGYLTKSSEKRGLDFIDRMNEFFVDVPVLGSASAGAPTIFAEEYVQGHLKVSKKIVGNKNVFAIQVHGTSMNLAQIDNKKIDDGDFIIVDSEYKDYKNGDKLLVVIDGLATVKKFKKINAEMMALFPESTNNEHRPIYLTPDDTFIINGKVIDVFKSGN